MILLLLLLVLIKQEEMQCYVVVLQTLNFKIHLKNSSSNSFMLIWKNWLLRFKVGLVAEYVLLKILQMLLEFHQKALQLSKTLKEENQNKKRMKLTLSLPSNES